jgi:hypothetical protein
MTPLSVACAYIFFRYCERPFLPRASKPARLPDTPPAPAHVPDPLLHESI